MNRVTNILDATADRLLQRLKDDAGTIVAGGLASSPRAVGDAVQMYLEGETGLKGCLPIGFADRFESGFARRSMEDMAFYSGNNYFAVDCKTHNVGTMFNMPNLISVQRLANFYRNDTNTFCILMVEYAVEGGKIDYKRCHFKPIEAFSWNCLTFGALGWGQIQIANANRLEFEENVDRRKWMIELCKRIDVFYGMEIDKITERRRWFEEVCVYWQNKN